MLLTGKKKKKKSQIIYCSLSFSANSDTTFLFHSFGVVLFTSCSEVLPVTAIFPGCAGFTDVYMQVTCISMTQGLSPNE